jgi:hypothetical protein
MAQNTPPYLVAPGSIRKCLDQIKKASTPDRVTQDFIQTKLAIKGGSGAALIPFLKKVGFVNSDGTPSELYKRFRNPRESGAAVAAAIKHGYRSLYEMNEYSHELADPEFKGLIVQVTGLAEDSPVVSLIQRTFKNLKEYADFNVTDSASSSQLDQAVQKATGDKGNITRTGSASPPGMNLSYTINLNLPATADIAVFNAIFRSLKENLLGDAR